MQLYVHIYSNVPLVYQYLSDSRSGLTYTFLSSADVKIQSRFVVVPSLLRIEHLGLGYAYCIYR